MTNRERMLAIIDGRPPDRIPWIPRPLLWHMAHSRLGTLPDHLVGLTLRQVEHELGMGTPAREGHVFVSEQTGDVEVNTRIEDHSSVTEYRTPAGTVSTRHRTTPELEALGISGLEVEHMIKEPADYSAVLYMAEHTSYRSCYDDYLRYEEEIGDDGYPLVHIGDCPFHRFLQSLTGYELGYYHLADSPGDVERFLSSIEEIERDRLWPIVAASPARLFLHGVHFDSSLTPPHYFEKYISPYYRDFSALLHESGKVLSMHADNDSRLILNQISEAGFDMAETFTTFPQVSCTLEEARQTWGTKVIIWGGVPSVLLEEAYEEAEFEAFMRGVFRAIAPGGAFILGVADNIMPGALIHRLERISEMVEEWGNVPIDAAAI